MAIKIIDHTDECSRSVGWAERHDGVSPLNGVRSLECKFLLAGEFDSKLMVSRRCVKQPQELTIPKFNKDCGVAAWNWVGNDASHRVQRMVVYTEAPDKFVDVADMFLMKFGGQNALK